MWCGLTPIIDEATKARDVASTSDNTPKELVESTTRVTKLLDDFLAYVEKMASPSSPIVDEIIKFTNEKNWQQFKSTQSFHAKMMTGHEEAQVLKMLVSMCKAKRVLEIGMFTGCATLAMAEALPTDGTVVTCDIDPDLEAIVRGFVDRSPHGKKITIKIGPAMQTLNVLKEQGHQFDFVFIDADASNKLNYYKFCLNEGILSPGGTVCVDNVLNGGTAYLSQKERSDHSAAKFNDTVAKDDRVYRVLLPVRDGMMLIRRKADVELD